MSTSKEKKSNKRKVIFNILVFIISIGLWSTIVYYGYNYAKDYFDTSINNVRLENEKNIKELNNEIILFSDEIKELKKIIDETDKSISNTTNAEKQVYKKLEELDKRMKQMQRSLNVLKEAPNDQK